MKKNNPLLIVFAIVFLDMLGFGMLIPVIPLLLGDPGSAYYLLPAGWDLGQGFMLLGFLLGFYPLMQFFSTPILGQLSDKYGRKKILLISLFGTLVGYLLFAYAILTANLWLLFFSRGLDGATGGNISVARAAIADVTVPADRSKSFGLIGAAFGLGFIFGPFIGGKLSDPAVLSWFSAATPFWFAAILSAINCVAVWLLMPETLENPQRGLVMEWRRSLHLIQNAVKMKRERHLFLTGFLYQGGFTFFTSFFGVFLIERFGFTQGNIGDFFAFLGIWIVIAQAVVVRMAARRWSEQKVLAVSMIGTGLAVFCYFLPVLPWQLFLVAPFFATFNGLTNANLNGLVSRSAGPEAQGRVLGVLSSVQALAGAIPPMLSGLVAAYVGPNSSVVVSGVILLSAGVVFNIMQRRLGAVVAAAE